MVHDTDRAPGADQPVDPPAAQRSPTAGWRDPRLWVGVVIVATSVVLGARVLNAADDTVAVWALADNLGAGDEVAAEDLVSTSVLFGDDGELERYVRVTDQLPADLTLTRGLGGGELLPRAALGDGAVAGTVQVALAVDDVRVPSSVQAGSVVDVYLLSGGAATDDGTDAGGGRGSQQARRGEAVLDDVVVIASAAEQEFGSVGRRKLELAVPGEAAPAFFALLAGSSEPVLSVARQP